jgi:ABC-type Fe3+ transport system substrate-binding protein
LRNPRYKGLLATTTYGGAWLPIAVDVGVNEVTSLLREIGANGNLKGFIPMTDVQSVASGQFGILLFTNSYATARNTLGANAPVATTALGVYTGTTLSLNIVKGTPSPNLAKLVGLFLATREGQDMLLQYTGYDSPFIPGSSSYEALGAARKRGRKIVIETDALIADNPQVYGPFAKQYAQLVGAA